MKNEGSEELREAPYESIDPNKDNEVRPLVVSFKTISAEQNILFGVHRFEICSAWLSLLRAIARIRRLDKSFRKFQKASETCMSPVTPD